MELKLKEKAEHEEEVLANQVSNGQPLAVACKHGHVEIVRYLLKHQCSREASDMEGNTPLMMSAMQVWQLRHHFYQKIFLDPCLTHHQLFTSLRGPRGLLYSATMVIGC